MSSFVVFFELARVEILAYEGIPWVRHIRAGPANTYLFTMSKSVDNS